MRGAQAVRAGLLGWDQCPHEGGPPELPAPPTEGAEREARSQGGRVPTGTGTGWRAASSQDCECSVSAVGNPSPRPVLQPWDGRADPTRNDSKGCWKQHSFGGKKLAKCILKPQHSPSLPSNPAPPHVGFHQRVRSQRGAERAWRAPPSRKPPPPQEQRRAREQQSPPTPSAGSPAVIQRRRPAPRRAHSRPLLPDSPADRHPVPGAAGVALLSPPRGQGAGLSRPRGGAGRVGPQGSARHTGRCPCLQEGAGELRPSWGAASGVSRSKGSSQLGRGSRGPRGSESPQVPRGAAGGRGLRPTVGSPWRGNVHVGDHGGQTAFTP